MSDQKIKILERALKREKLARKEAERILEKKSLELYEKSEELASINQNLSKVIDVYKSTTKFCASKDVAGMAFYCSGHAHKPSCTTTKSCGRLADSLSTIHWLAVRQPNVFWLSTRTTDQRPVITLPQCLNV